jgi:methylase of polypeptide subunit release factors
MKPDEASILALGRALQRDGYHFIAPTPLTYCRIHRRASVTASPLVQFFGWNRPVSWDELPATYRTILDHTTLIEAKTDAKVRSKVRFSSLGSLLLVHSPFPTEEEDAVFFGPDTYRFARAIRWLAQTEPGFHPKTIADIGTGTGAGALYARTMFPSLETFIFADISHKALNFADINCRLNGLMRKVLICSNIFAKIVIEPDLVISNPPYLLDAHHRTYRHGGGEWGCKLGVDIVRQALARLSPCGSLLLYTGAPIVDGQDMFLQAVKPHLDTAAITFSYEEIDPDVFGEELEASPYDRADRIANTVLFVKGSDLIRKS